MSHRTRDLPPLRGLPQVFRELRYHEASRQLLALVLIVLYTSVAQPTPLLFAVGVPFVLAGTALRLYASGFILKNEELATNGPYALMRHPLYTGNIMAVVGFSISSGTWWTLPVTLAFLYFYYPTAIEYEDRKLHLIFGSRWQQWAPAWSLSARPGSGCERSRWRAAAGTRRGRRRAGRVSGLSQWRIA